MRKCANNSCENEACRPTGRNRVDQLCRSCNAKRRDKQANSRAQPKCQCGNCLPLGGTVCGGCSRDRESRLAQLEQDLREIRPSVEPDSPDAEWRGDPERIKVLEAELAELTVDRDVWKDRAGLMLRLKDAETGRADELQARLDGALDNAGAANLKSLARYILLRDGDVVGAEDEFLRDDAVSWCVNGPRSSWLGAIFNSGFHMPMRRRVSESMEEGIAV